ncbi:hypothetical protein NHX12_021087 [Muraenolepis orangiensis]|uniref:Uncharacterized protein n=1 Tax=Muraenolepis orangiensis TaxID=630683 RepID=A0A9Q0ESF3_9TELE|nr:hypothetical protein NHX12_021087 [Muraenolepis orangiensis]
MEPAITPPSAPPSHGPGPLQTTHNTADRSLGFRGDRREGKSKRVSSARQEVVPQPWASGVVVLSPPPVPPPSIFWVLHLQYCYIPSPGNDPQITGRPAFTFGPSPRPDSPTLSKRSYTMGGQDRWAVEMLHHHHHHHHHPNHHYHPNHHPNHCHT